MKIRKAYLFVTLVSLFIAVTGAVKYRVFVKNDFGEATLPNFILQIVATFLICLIPGLLLARWYYRLGNKQ